MNVRELFIFAGLPTDVKMLYKGLVKRKFDLKNGWIAIVLKNNMAILLRYGLQKMSFGAVKHIVSASDGKFMLIKENEKKAIWNKDGKCLSDFSSNAELFSNGWYKKKINDGLALFDNNGDCIGQNLQNTKVFPNGFFFMSVKNADDGHLAGVYNNKKEKLIFTNSSHICMLNNGWFIAEGELFDNSGIQYLSLHSSSKLSLLLLKGVGSLIPLLKRYVKN